MFVNFSNHPSSKWSEAQAQAAAQWGEIVDYPFPNVTAKTSEEEIRSLADRVVCDIAALKPDAVMCQGEFTLTFSVVERLKEQGILTLAACSERVVEEHIGENGEYEKAAVFRFVRFREY